MRFLIMTDIEGVTGVTTYLQAEKSQFGRDMLMNDLLAVIDGIRSEEHHEIVVYDMHTDGRNIDITQLPKDVPVVMGKPINGQLYRGVGNQFDGLFLVGLHAMSKVPGAMLAHSYLREYESIHINGELVGEIGVERALAGEQGIPLVFVSGDDKGCEEANQLDSNIVTAVVKTSLGEDQALCKSAAYTRDLLKNAASMAVKCAKNIMPKKIMLPVKIQIKYSKCNYLDVMKELYPNQFTDDTTVEMEGDNLLSCWSEYLRMEKEMVSK